MTTNKRILRSENRRGIQNHENPNARKSEPFGLSDGKLKFGKYKRKHINDVSKDYIKWIIDSFDLAPTHKSILQDLLKGKKYI
tara:strand:+ start:1657 stop:1905 length:249 start_codon:yes stop_codon:yes gene_type:complete